MHPNSMSLMSLLTTPAVRKGVPSLFLDLENQIAEKAL